MTVLFAFAPWVRILYVSTNTKPAGDLKRSDASAQHWGLRPQHPKDLACFWVFPHNVRFTSVLEAGVEQLRPNSDTHNPPTKKKGTVLAKSRIGNKVTGILPRAHQSISESFGRNGTPNKFPFSKPKKTSSVQTSHCCLNCSRAKSGRKHTSWENEVWEWESSFTLVTLAQANCSPMGLSFPNYEMQRLHHEAFPSLAENNDPRHHFS